MVVPRWESIAGILALQSDKQAEKLFVLEMTTATRKTLSYATPAKYAKVFGEYKQKNRRTNERTF